ncbi:MAG: hypothetical protein HC876_01010 [Chloroflexaceae bacterium]|nr:hypothetical protein [Chloroflexaceae bacterium]
MQAVRVAASPDGQLVAAGTISGEITVWNARTGQMVNQFQAFRSAIRALTFSSDGQAIIASNSLAPDVDEALSEPTIGIWDAVDSTLLHTLTGHTSQVIGLAAIPGDTLFVSISSAELRVWDTVSGSEVRNTRPSEGAFTSIAVSPDGRLIVAGGTDGRLAFWEAVLGRLMYTTQYEGGDVQGLAFHPAGTELAITHRDGRVVRYIIPDGDQS